MAVKFFLDAPGKDGAASIRIRVQSRSPKVDVKQKTPLRIKTSIWNLDRNDPKFEKLKLNPEIKKIFDCTDEIRSIIEGRISGGQPLSARDIREIMQDVVYRDIHEQQKVEAEEAARKEAEANRVTLLKYIEWYIDEVTSGARQTEAGTNYSYNTVKALNQALLQFQRFCTCSAKDYDFDDINMRFYYDYTAFLKTELKDKNGKVIKKAYNVNSTGKCIKALKMVMSAAESEGYHHNEAWKDRHFKGSNIEVDSICLTKEELARVMAVDLSRYGAGHTWARDIFMVGCWTAQRVSDYNRISKDQIETMTKRWIEDVPDPEHPGQTKPEIRTKEIMFINIRQQKTGARVSVPISSECRAILEKYDYNMPHLEDAVLNRYLKDICRDAGLTEEIEIVQTTGGTPVRVIKPKYKLVHSHTARRTGATLMYLSGMDVYDIIKITGHSSPLMLRKYIKADKLEIVQKLTDKYNYFD